MTQPPTPPDHLDLDRPLLPPPAVDPHRGWWVLPLGATLMLLMVWIGLDQQSRLQAQAATTVTGTTMALDYSPEGAARARALLAKGGMTLVETEEGIQAVPITSLKAARAEAASKVGTAQPRLRNIMIPKEDLTPLAPFAGPPGSRPMIAVIIDDVGLVRENSARAADLKGAFTLAFLPYAEDVQPLVERARANGHEIMLHLPMQGRETADPGPRALLNGLNSEELAQRLDWSLARFSGYDGVNNHMGSQFTENAEGMAQVMQALKARGLFFIDSRTTQNSAARQAATENAVPYAERDVFLDNEQDSVHIAIQLQEAEARARRYGTAIAIGHPHSATIATLAAWQRQLARRGIDLVPASRIIAARGTPDWRLALSRQKPAG